MSQIKIALFGGQKEGMSKYCFYADFSRFKAI